VGLVGQAKHFPSINLPKLNFGKLILVKINEIAVTRWHILKLQCTKYDFGWRSAPDPAGGAYCAGFHRPTSKGKGEKGRRHKREGEE